MADELGTTNYPDVTATAAPGESKPASDESSEKELRKWRNRVETAKKLRGDWEVEYQVEKCESYILGKQAMEPGELVLNHVYATIQTQKPNLFFTNPKFLARPKQGAVSPTTSRQAAIAEGILQSIAEQDFNLEIAGSLALSQAFPRMGVLKSVYDPQLEPNPQAGEPIYETGPGGEPIPDQSKFKPRMDPATGAPVLNPMTGQPEIDPQSVTWLQMKDPQTGGPLTEPDKVISDEVYRWEYVDAKNMLLPDQGPDESKWTWIGEEVVVPLDVAKKDSRFNPTYRSQLTANETQDSRYRSTRNLATTTTFAMQGDSEDEGEQLFRYYECYDIRNKRMLAFADGQDFDGFLINDDLPDGIEDHPYSLLRFDLILGPKPSPWPLPHIFNWLPIQREYNLRRQQITEGCKRTARKIFYDEATFDDPDEAAKALQSSKDMEAVKIRDLNRPPKETQDVNISGDIFRDIPLLMTDWRLVTGQPGARLGDPEKETATEVSFVERASNLRDSDLQRAVSRWMSMAGRKMLQLVKETITLDLWVRIRGYDDEEIAEYAQRLYGLTPDQLRLFPGIRDALAEKLGNEKLTHVTREQLTFEASISIIPGSSRPRNLDVERGQWLSFLQLFGQFPQLALSRELLRETGAKFEFVSERAMDELAALAQKMIMIQQIQAGRGQNGSQAPSQGQGIQPPTSQGRIQQATTQAAMGQGL